MIKCEICKKEYKTLCTHLKVHKLNIKQYKQLFPFSPTIRVETKKMLSVKAIKSYTSGLRELRRRTTSESWKNTEVRRKRIMNSKHPHKSHPSLSFATKAKISRALKGHPNLMGNKNSMCREDVKTKRTKTLVENILKLTPEEKRKRFSLPVLGIPKVFSNPEEHSKNLSFAAKRQWKQIREKMLQSMQVSNSRKPSGFESDFLKVCKEKGVPVRYVGNGEFWITTSKEFKHLQNALNPDFVLEPFSQTKTVVELLGDFWHDDNDIKLRKEMYKSIANEREIRVIFIQEHTFYKNKIKVVEKILEGLKSLEVIQFIQVK